MTDIIKDLQWRYAVKKFDKNKKLSVQQIELLKQAFNLTPTSYGLQSIRLVIVTDEEKKNMLQKTAYDQEQVSTCSHLLVICSQTDFGTKDIERFIELNIAAIPEKKAYFTKYGQTLKERFAQKTPSEIKNWADDQAHIALGNLLNVCASAKIDSCPMAGFEPEKVNDYLGLKDKGLSAVILLPVGIRAKDDSHQFDPKVRRTLNEMIIDI